MRGNQENASLSVRGANAAQTVTSALAAAPGGERQATKPWRPAASRKVSGEPNR